MALRYGLPPLAQKTRHLRVKVKHVPVLRRVPRCRLPVKDKKLPSTNPRVPGCKIAVRQATDCNRSLEITGGARQRPLTQQAHRRVQKRLACLEDCCYLLG